MAIETPLRFTISIGLVTFNGHSDINTDTVIQALNQRRYKAKHAGRNILCAVTYAGSNRE